MADVGAAWQNGYAERLIRTVKEEEVDLSEYIDYNDAYRQLGRFLDEVYMYKRIHSSLGYLTPGRIRRAVAKGADTGPRIELKIAQKCPISGGQFTSPHNRFALNSRYEYNM
jgi:hypothetical protein